MIISNTSSFGERKWIAARDYDIISSINFIYSKKKKKLSYITSISRVFIKIKKKKICNKIETYINFTIIE